MCKESKAIGFQERKTAYVALPVIAGEARREVSIIFLFLRLKSQKAK